MYHGSLNIPLDSADCFVLELLVQNLKFNPRIVREFFQQLESKLAKKKINLADAEDGYKRNHPGGGGFIFTNVRLADETLLKK